MDLEKLITELPGIMSQFASAGPLGLAAAAIIGVFSLWLYYRWTKLKRDAAHNETQRNRASEQADNATENAKADHDAAKAEGDIEEIINAAKREG